MNGDATIRKIRADRTEIHALVAAVGAMMMMGIGDITVY
jgi:hypothetical protein